MDFEMMEILHSYSAIMTIHMVVKKEDLNVFTIHCTIEVHQFGKVLCHLGERINLMSFDLFKKLRLSDPKFKIIRLLMVDQSIKSLMGILYDVLV